MIDVVVEDQLLVKRVKSLLESQGLLNKKRKILKVDNSRVISTTTDNKEQLQQILADFDGINYQHSDSKEIEAPVQNDLTSIISSLLPERVPKEVRSKLLSKVPKKYSLYPPLLLINNHETFESEEWQNLLSSIDRDQFFTSLLQRFNISITHIAINRPIIEQDIMRRPFNLIPIHGDFGSEPTDELFDSPSEQDLKDAFWCTVIQNSIYQTWAPKYTMFSRGNIKEKARILEFKDVKGTTVVDLYAGIGYFTLSYLKLGAKHLFCFEINPWSIEGLIRGVKKNGYSYRVIQHGQKFQYDPDVSVFIFHESNEFAMSRLQTMELLPISHINLGLLPSSRPSWPIAIEIFGKHSILPQAMMHIHENVAVDQLDCFLDQTCGELMQISSDEHIDLMVEPSKLNKVKTFAPDIWHIVGDIGLYTNR